MMLTPYPGMVPEINSPFRTVEYDDEYVAMWPSQVNGVSLLREPPPFSIQRSGSGGQPSPGAMPAFITPASANVTGWQDLLSASKGYPAPMGTQPACNQATPMASNWAGAYVPQDVTLSNWAANNPVLAMLVGLAALATGAVLSRKL